MILRFAAASGDKAKAVDVIERRLAAGPEDAELVNHLACLVRERASATADADGTLLGEQLTRFNEAEGLMEVATGCFQRLAKKLAVEEKRSMTVLSQPRSAPARC